MIRNNQQTKTVTIDGYRFFYVYFVLPAIYLGLFFPFLVSGSQGDYLTKIESLLKSDPVTGRYCF